MARVPKEPDHRQEIREAKTQSRRLTREMRFRRRRRDDDFDEWNDGWGDGFDVYVIDILRSKRRFLDADG